jgi:hypothetical protein
MHVGSQWESGKVRDRWEDQDVGGWAILKWSLDIRWDGMDWTDMAQDRDQWRAPVNTAMNLLIQ